MPADSDRADPPVPWLRGYACLALAVSGALAAVYVLVPSARWPLRGEDGVVEWASAALFFASFALGLWRVLASRRWAYLWVPFVGLVGLYDELSFGERFLGMEPPHVEGVKIDAAHDFVEVAYRWLRDSAPPALPLAAAAVALLAAWLVAHHRVRLLGLARRAPPLAYAALAAAFLAPALLVDVHLFGERGVVLFGEELAEMNVALAWVFAALAIANRARGRGPGQYSR